MGNGKGGDQKRDERREEISTKSEIRIKLRRAYRRQKAKKIVE